MRQDGFSILEMVVSTAITLIIAGVAVALVDPGRASFAIGLESADMQQRLRAAAGTLYADLVMAGTGDDQSPNRGPLSYYFASVLPYRRGTNHDDPAGTYRTDTISVLYVPPTVARSTLASDLPRAVSADISVNADAGCPTTDVTCGFKEGMGALVYDARGDHDTFTITNVQANLLHVERTGGAPTQTDYGRNTTTVVEVANVVYSLKNDASTGTYQLISRTGGAGSDVPVVDHLVALKFDYYGDPQPPVLIKALIDPVGPWTTYGPPPPAPGDQLPSGGYPAGENCTFTVDPNGMQVPRLVVLGSGANALVQLTSAELTDGPWCPDALSPTRWDADLLRVRRVGVTLRVEAAILALRGPASLLFSHGGTARNGNRWLPDREITFQVSPRNLK